MVKNSSAWCGTLLQRHTMIVLHVNVLTEVCILVLPLTGFANVLVQIRRLITASREMTSDTYEQQGAWKCRLSGSTASHCLIFCSFKLNKSKEFKELSAVPKLQRVKGWSCFFFFFFFIRHRWRKVNSTGERKKMYLPSEDTFLVVFFLEPQTRSLFITKCSQKEEACFSCTVTKEKSYRSGCPSSEPRTQSCPQISPDKIAWLRLPEWEIAGEQNDWQN